MTRIFFPFEIYKNVIRVLKKPLNIRLSENILGNSEYDCDITEVRDQIHIEVWKVYLFL